MVAKIIIHGGCDDEHISHDAVVHRRSGTARGQNIGIGKIEPAVCQNGHRVQRGIYFSHTEHAEGNPVLQVQCASLGSIWDLILFRSVQIVLIIKLCFAREVPTHLIHLEFRQDEDLNEDFFCALRSLLHYRSSARNLKGCISEWHQ